MEALRIVIPVIVMLIIGIVCRRTAMINKNGVDNIKKFITTVALPVSVFHAVSTAEYNKKVVWVFAIMFVVVVIAFLCGFALKKVIDEPYRKYFPYLMTIYEGGMMAYPLYQSLMGEEYMSNIALIDVSCGIFAFGIYFGMLTVTDSGERTGVKQLVKNAFKSPVFVALVFGICVGLTGVMGEFLSTGPGMVYLSCKEMIASPVSAMILLCVGYEFCLDKEIFGVCLKTVVVRLVLQSVLLGGVIIIAIGIGLSKPMIIGLILYMYTIPSLCLSSFVKNDYASRYMSTTSSIYLIITLIAYTLLATVMA